MKAKASIRPLDLLRGIGDRRTSVFAMILLGALLAFEIFNYSTTDFALTDVLGDLAFGPLRWATILSLAFCGIDFAGLARLFTPQTASRDEPAEVWYLFAAWLLAAAMNAILTWWGVSVAVSGHNAAGSFLLGASFRTAVPIFVALMVWLIRILIIGTFSLAGDQMFNGAEARSYRRPPAYQQDPQPAQRPAYGRPAPRPQPAAIPSARREPSYHPVGVSATARDENRPPWR